MLSTANLKVKCACAVDSDRRVHVRVVTNAKGTLCWLYVVTESVPFLKVDTIFQTSVLVQAHKRHLSRKQTAEQIIVSPDNVMEAEPSVLFLLLTSNYLSAIFRSSLPFV